MPHFLTPLFSSSSASSRTKFMSTSCDSDLLAVSKDVRSLRKYPDVSDWISSSIFFLYTLLSQSKYYYFRNFISKIIRFLHCVYSWVISFSLLFDLDVIISMRAELSVPKPCDYKFLIKFQQQPSDLFANYLNRFPNFQTIIFNRIHHQCGEKFLKTSRCFTFKFLNQILK